MLIEWQTESTVKLTSDWRVDAIRYLEPHIIYYARRYQCRETTLEDYCQELTFHLWRKLLLYRSAGQANLRTWASKVMWNKCRDIARDRRRTRQRGRPPKLACI
jgi:RNA polymerase sigma factor (sigma-70 family)